MNREEFEKTVGIVKKKGTLQKIKTYFKNLLKMIKFPSSKKMERKRANLDKIPEKNWMKWAAVNGSGNIFLKSLTRFSC